MHNVIHSLNVKLTRTHWVKDQVKIKTQLTKLVYWYPKLFSLTLRMGARKSGQVSLLLPWNTSLVALVLSSIFYRHYLWWVEAQLNWLVKIMFNRGIFLSKENFKIYCFHRLLEDGRVFLVPVFVLSTTHLLYLNLIN